DFTADFYLWFRFKKELDDSNIVFDNSVLPFRLGKQVVNSLEDGVYTRTYLVRNNFRADFDFTKYPFDRQILPLQFRHKVLKKDKIIYAKDVSGLAKKEQMQGVNTSRMEPNSRFVIKTITSFEDFFINAPKSVDLANILDPQKFAHSQFNTFIEIEKKNHYARFVLFVPLVFFFAFLYLQLYFKGRKIKLRSYIILTILLSVTLFHIGLRYTFQVEYLMAIEFSILAVYGLLFFSLLELLLLIGQDEEGRTKFVKYYFLFLKVLMPIPVFVLTFWYMLL
ncbi:MAG: hypothetical protein AAF518_06300, partial [Spirochaetota bacterium]